MKVTRDIKKFDLYHQVGQFEAGVYLEGERMH